MATFAVTASLSSTANNFLQGSALSINQRTLQTVNKDTALNTLYVSPAGTQAAYVSSDTAGSVAETSYIYIQSSTTNPADGVNVVFVSKSIDVRIARLKPGDWAYIPYQRLENHPDSSSVKLVNINASTGSYVTVLYGESGSL